MSQRSMWKGFHCGQERSKHQIWLCVNCFHRLSPSQEADITRRAPEAACWLRLGWWSNNSANSHPSLGVLNRRVLRACLVPQYSYQPHRHHYQRRLANCDCMPASYISGHPSNPRRHPTCWASSRWSHAVCSTPCNGVWTSASLGAHPPIECKRTAPYIETPVCTRRTTSHQFVWQQHTCGAVDELPMECGVDGKPHTTPHFYSRQEPGSGNPGILTWVTVTRVIWGHSRETT